MAQQSTEKRYAAVSQFNYLAWKALPTGASALAVVNPSLVRPAKIGAEIVGTAMVMRRFTPAGIKDSQVVKVSNRNGIYAPMESLKLAGSKPTGDDNFSGVDGDAKPINLSRIIGSVGFLGGLYYALTQKSGFWGYVGYGLLGSIAGTTVGAIGKEIFYPSK